MKIYLLLLFLVAACSNETKTTSSTTNPDDGGVHAGATDTLVTNKQLFVLSGCYEMIMKRDTALLTLQVSDTTVTGNLRYHWYQKDQNDGTIKGVLRNDRIHADYTFQSEGTTSVREVIFKIQDTTLLQGAGDLTEQNGKVVYRHPEALSFDATHPFIKTVCLPNANR